MEAQERVIVSFDIEPGRIQWYARQLKGIVRSIKIPVFGRTNLQMINLLKSDFSIVLDLRCMADPEALEAQIQYLEFFSPQVITVMAISGSKIMEFMTKYFKGVEIVAVIGLDLFGQREFNRIFNSTRSEATVTLAKLALESGINSLLCTPGEFDVLKNAQDMRTIKYYVKNVVPGWSKAKELNQNTITPKKAVESAVSRMIVRGPIIDSDDPRSAADAIIQEISQAQKKVSKRRTLNINPDTVKQIATERTRSNK